MDTYEKKYKEALERARNLRKDAIDMGENLRAKECEIIFPELKESEDERIRKAIHIYLDWLDGRNKDYQPKGDYSIKDMIAWLEKQGEPMEINPTEFDTRLQTLIGKFDNLPKEELIGSLSFWLNVVQNNGTYKDEEKQGEQKPVLIIPKFRIGDNIKTTNEEPLTITKIDGKGYWSEDLFICDFDDAAKWELEERNPADKVEPKFKVGDWVVYTGYLLKDSGIEIYVMQVASVEDDRYNFTDTSTLCFDSEKDMRLWTIQDAKDGDVLCCESGWTCIFKTLNSDNISFSSYCFMENTGWFCETGSESHTLEKAFIKAYNGNIYPATKEQRDLLFQKIHEAGYEWDAEKKELKKIEQTPAEWHREDEQNLNACLGFIPDEFLRRWLKDVVHVKYDKPAWSEEDELVIKDIEEAITNYWHGQSQEDLLDRLKSIKQRIGG